MGEEIADSSSQLRNADLNAIATYLKTRPGQTPAARSIAINDPMMAAGAAIYQDLCFVCHRSDGHGVPYLIPNLATAAQRRSCLQCGNRRELAKADSRSRENPVRAAAAWNQQTCYPVLKSAAVSVSQHASPDLMSSRH
jgi:cytochrome c553